MTDDRRRAELIDASRRFDGSYDRLIAMGAIMEAFEHLLALCPYTRKSPEGLEALRSAYRAMNELSRDADQAELHWSAAEAQWRRSA